MKESFRHNELYSKFEPRIKVEAPKGSGQICYMIEPNFDHGYERVWVGTKLSEPYKLIILSR